MARKTIIVCDNCGTEVADNKGGTLTFSWFDARKGLKRAELCGDCGDKMPGQHAVRRGRKPKAVTG